MSLTSAVIAGYPLGLESTTILSQHDARGLKSSKPHILSAVTDKMWGFSNHYQCEKKLVGQALHAQAFDTIQCVPQCFRCGLRGIDSPVRRGGIALQLPGDGLLPDLRVMHIRGLVHGE